MDNPLAGIKDSVMNHKQEWALAIAAIGLIVTLFIWKSNQSGTQNNTASTLPNTSPYAGTPSTDPTQAYDQLALSITQLTNQVASALNKINTTPTITPITPSKPPVTTKEPPGHIPPIGPVRNPILNHRVISNITPNEHDDITGITHAITNWQSNSYHGNVGSSGYVGVKAQPTNVKKVKTF
jgi:hypothetical protein